jgi:hypothetical protein
MFKISKMVHLPIPVKTSIFMPRPRSLLAASISGMQSSLRRISGHLIYAMVKYGLIWWWNSFNIMVVFQHSELLLNFGQLCWHCWWNTPFWMVSININAVLTGEKSLQDGLRKNTWRVTPLLAATTEKRPTVKYMKCIEIPQTDRLAWIMDPNTGWWCQTSWKIWVQQWEGLSDIQYYGNIRNVWNHQPATIRLFNIAMENHRF